MKTTKTTETTTKTCATDLVKDRVRRMQEDASAAFLQTIEAAKQLVRDLEDKKAWLSNPKCQTTVAQATDWAANDIQNFTRNYLPRLSEAHANAVAADAVLDALEAVKD